MLRMLNCRLWRRARCVDHEGGAQLRIAFLVGCVAPVVARRRAARSHRELSPLPFGWLVFLPHPTRQARRIYANHAAASRVQHALQPRSAIPQCALAKRWRNWSDERSGDCAAPRLRHQPLVTGPHRKSIAPFAHLCRPWIWKTVLAVMQPHRAAQGREGPELAAATEVSRALTSPSATDGTLLDEYSARALARVWKSTRFSWCSPV